MKRNTYINIPAFARLDLNLQGNEMLVFSLVFGFSQDGRSRFTGSSQYVADWVGCSRRSAINYLNSLVDSGYVVKDVKVINGVTFNEFWANLPLISKIVNDNIKKEQDLQGYAESAHPPMQNLHGGCEKSAHNIIEDNTNLKNSFINVPTNVETSSEKNDFAIEKTKNGKLIKLNNLIPKKEKKEKPLKRAAAVFKKLYNQFESVEDAMATFYKYNPDHVKAAFDLHKLILKNMNRLQVPTKQRENGKVEPDINDIRKLFNIDGATKEQFNRALKNLDGHIFWDKNVQSASKFREKFNQLAAVQKEPTEKNAKSNSTEPTIKALNHDYIPPSY